MEPESELTKTPTTRHKCSACFKQYKLKEHLIAHMKKSLHSPHQPKCGVCEKHCKSFESLREHICGPLAKADCSEIFKERGCGLCLEIFDSPNLLNKHKEICCLPAPVPLETIRTALIQSETDILGRSSQSSDGGRIEAVAIDCEMVGGGTDGTLDICARVCLIDEEEKILFHTYVEPIIPVTDYRTGVTGITEDHLKDAMPLKEVRDKLMNILQNGESLTRLRLDGGKAKCLVGHSLDNDLNCLRMNYPDHLLRDTAKYRPLMKTNLASHSLKTLTRTYLGYEIQTGVHDPYEDAVSAMRLYKRMRGQDHPLGKSECSDPPYHTKSFANPFDSWQPKELEKMTPDELFKISKLNYRCWCLDLRCSPKPQLELSGIEQTWPSWPAARGRLENRATWGWGS